MTKKIWECCRCKICNARSRWPTIKYYRDVDGKKITGCINVLGMEGISDHRGTGALCINPKPERWKSSYPCDDWMLRGKKISRLSSNEWPWSINWAKVISGGMREVWAKVISLEKIQWRRGWVMKHCCNNCIVCKTLWKGIKYVIG